MMTTVLAFLVAIGVLVAVHNTHGWRDASASVCPVLDRLRRPLLSGGADGTERVLAAIPLRQAPRRAQDLCLLLRQQRVQPQARLAAGPVLLAGPFANFVFAVCAYCAVRRHPGAEAVLGEITAVRSPRRPVW
jgi:hypothetical protein